MIDHELLTRAIAYGLDDGFQSLTDKAEAIGEAFGRGWRRANPPLGLVGRRCTWEYADQMHTGTILMERDTDGALLVEIDSGDLVTTALRRVTLLPWTSDEVTP
jgi:hypothetical protein